MAEQDSGHYDTPEGRLALFNFAFEHAPIGIALLNAQGKVVRCNAALLALLGRAQAKLIGHSLETFTYAEDVQAERALLDAILAGRSEGYSIEKRFTLPDGRIVQTRVHLAVMRDEAGAAVRFITQVEDITRQKQHEIELAERAAQVELAMEALQGGFWHMDIAANRFLTSEKLAHFIGGPEMPRLDLDAYLRRVRKEDMTAADLQRLINGQIDQSVAEYRLQTVAGERWIRCDRRLLRDGSGQPVRIVGVAVDFTDERHRLEQMALKAQTDALTGLLNRRGLDDGYEAMASPAGYVVLAMDLDGFKPINDRYGHAAGDLVLLETARRLRANLRDHDLVARVGGDEFVLVLAADREGGCEVAERLIRAVREPILLAKESVAIGASIGGLWTPVKSAIDELCARADLLLYQVKMNGKNRWHLE
ncbi:sensor domain-containing diguanylate cyclase [Rhizobium sp. SSA_523]|uniref:sensor domain-containing diguanylate cyclase n=1 Tax=Rhizobium sp. SSA_523 TaxID=2952477 RepID=UPI0020906B0B|nr:sensor domain-containing diguanylate cyclase [Rhizobium sp. SSA_523]MCO5732397.1 diguanylate cyclase [Rhizobium sp. SSA_523]WKC22457.1 diguanylate cyclase [Rhizobium sp. SSA_523]